MVWMNEAPQHMVELRSRVQRLFPRVARLSEAATAVTNLGEASAAEQPVTTLELKTATCPPPSSIWTGSV